MVFIGGVCSTKTCNGDHGVGGQWGEGYLSASIKKLSKLNLPYNSCIFSQKRVWQTLAKEKTKAEKKWCRCLVHSVLRVFSRLSPREREEPASTIIDQDAAAAGAAVGRRRHRTERAHHHRVCSKDATSAGCAALCGTDSRQQRQCDTRGGPSAMVCVCV